MIGGQSYPCWRRLAWAPWIRRVRGRHFHSNLQAIAGIARIKLWMRSKARREREANEAAYRGCSTHPRQSWARRNAIAPGDGMRETRRCSAYPGHRGPTRTRLPWVPWRLLQRKPEGIRFCNRGETEESFILSIPLTRKMLSYNCPPSCVYSGPVFEKWKRKYVIKDQERKKKRHAMLPWKYWERRA